MADENDIRFVVPAAEVDAAMAALANGETLREADPEGMFNRASEAALGSETYRDGVSGAMGLEPSALRASFLATIDDQSRYTEEHLERKFLAFTAEAARELRKYGAEPRGQETRAQALAKISAIRKDLNHPYWKSKDGDFVFAEFSRLYKVAFD